MLPIFIDVSVIPRSAAAANPETEAIVMAMAAVLRDFCKAFITFPP
jgi:hypothetical protein